MFKLDFVTPESRIVVDQELEELTLPAERGELDILPGHSPLMTIVKPGVLSYRLKNGEKGKFAVSWGYAQISERGVVVLAETATSASEVNVKEDQDLLRKLEAQLGTEALDDVEWNRVQSEVALLKAELDLSTGYSASAR